MGDLIATQFHARDDGVRLAYRLNAGNGPWIVFLPGYASDMSGSKASALFGWACAAGRNCLLLDYSGCGESDGAFDEGTIAVWRDDALHLIDNLTTGPLVLVGSSMGGWLMLLIALARADRIAALIGIAAAPDFTDWGFSQAEKLDILTHGRLERPSAYDDSVMVTTRAFWQSGEANRLLQGQIAIDCPVRLLHGQHDADVPWHHSTHLAALLRSADVQTVLVKDGDHRLSRDTDIALMIGTVQGLLDRL